MQKKLTASKGKTLSLLSSTLTWLADDMERQIRGELDELKETMKRESNGAPLLIFSPTHSSYMMYGALQTHHGFCPNPWNSTNAPSSLPQTSSNSASKALGRGKR
jgi:hypothetical protein